MKFNIKHFFQYNRITKDNEENFETKNKKNTIFLVIQMKDTILKQLNISKKYCLVKLI